MKTRFVCLVAVLFAFSCRKTDAPSGPCPEGAKLVGAPPPEGSQQKCVLAANESIKHGPFKEWWPGSVPPKLKREGAFDQGKLTGKWTTWHESGRPQREVTYVADVLQGKHVEHYDNATSTVKESGEYRDGLRIGVWHLFHDGGTKERDLEHMPNGEQRWTVFAPNGAKVMSGIFVDGTKHGLFTEFYPNGAKASEGMWKSSKKDGKWIYWDAGGTEIATEEYVAGKVTSSSGIVPARALPPGLDVPATAGSAPP